MKIKRVSLIVIVVMVVNVLLSSFVFATQCMDYKKYIEKLIKDYGYFKTPISNFKVYVNGEYKASTDVETYTSRVENVSQLPNTFTAKVGDKIKLKNISSVGSGNRIKYYDFQVGKDYVGNVAQGDFENYGRLKEITLDTPGTWVAFLNVADDYSDIPNFTNFSQYGNWRTTMTKNIDDDIQVQGWYFTAMKFEVEEDKPEPDPPEPSGDINAVIDGPSILEVGKRLQLDSSSSYSTYEIVKREWFILDHDRYKHIRAWDNEISPRERVTEQGTKKYKLIITDSKGHTDEDTHEVDVSKGEPVSKAKLHTKYIDTDTDEVLKTETDKFDLPGTYSKDFPCKMTFKDRIYEYVRGQEKGGDIDGFRYNKNKNAYVWKGYVGDEGGTDLEVEYGAGHEEEGEYEAIILCYSSDLNKIIYETTKKYSEGIHKIYAPNLSNKGYKLDSDYSPQNYDIIKLSETSPRKIVKFYYTNESNGIINVECREKGSNKLIKTEMLEDQPINERIIVKAPELGGYSSGSPSRHRVTLTKDESEKTVVFEYEKDIPLIEDNGVINIECREKGSNKLIKTEMLEDQPIDEEIIVKAPKLVGYNPGSPSQIKVTLTEDEPKKTIVFEYRKEHVEFLLAEYSFYSSPYYKVPTGTYIELIEEKKNIKEVYYYYSFYPESPNKIEGTWPFGKRFTFSDDLAFFIRGYAISEDGHYFKNNESYSTYSNSKNFSENDVLEKTETYKQKKYSKTKKMFLDFSYSQLEYIIDPSSIEIYSYETGDFEGGYDYKIKYGFTSYCNVGHDSELVVFENGIELPGVINVECREKGSNKLIKTEMLEDQPINERIIVKAPELGGYSSGSPSRHRVTLTKDESEKTVVFRYEKDIPPIEDNGVINVECREKGSNKLIKTKVLEDQPIDEEIIVKAPKLVGYSSGSPSQIKVTLTEDEPEKTVVFRYEKDIPPPVGGKGEIVFSPDDSYFGSHREGWQNRNITVNVSVEGDKTAIIPSTAPRTYEYEEEDKEGNKTIKTGTASCVFTETWQVGNISVNGAATGTVNGMSGGNVSMSREGKNLQLSARLNKWVSVKKEWGSDSSPEGHWTDNSTPSGSTTPPALYTGTSGVYKLDKHNPSSNTNISSKDWTNKPFSVNITAKDNLSGFWQSNSYFNVSDRSYYNNNHGNTNFSKGSTNQTKTFNVKENGVYTIKTYLEDIARNTMPTATYGEYKFDNIAPYKVKFDTIGCSKVVERHIPNIGTGYQYMADYDNKIRVTIGDDLSGLEGTRFLITKSSTFPSVGSMKNLNENTDEAINVPIRKTFYINLNSGNTKESISASKFKELKEGLWYVHVYQRDRAGNETRSTSKPIFINKMRDLRITGVADYGWKDYFVDENGNPTNLTKQGIKVADMPIYHNKEDKGIKLGYKVYFKIDTVGFDESKDVIKIKPKFYGLDEDNKLSEVDIYVEDDNSGDYKLIQNSGYKNMAYDITLTSQNRMNNEYTSDKKYNTWEFDYFITFFMKAVKKGQGLSLDDLAKDNYYKHKLLIVFEIEGNKNYNQSFYYTIKEDNWAKGNGNMYGRNRATNADLGFGINHGEVFWYNLYNSAMDDFELQRGW